MRAGLLDEPIGSRQGSASHRVVLMGVCGQSAATAELSWDVIPDVASCGSLGSPMDATPAHRKQGRLRELVNHGRFVFPSLISGLQV